MTLQRLVLIAALGLLACEAGFALPRALVLRIDQADLAWGDSRLVAKLTTALTRDPEIRVVVADHQVDSFRPFPPELHNLDSLLDWGTGVGGRYLLLIQVDREGLECRKTFSVPVLFHRWETLAVITGEMRLIDLQKRRLVLAEPFHEKLTASRQFQSSSEDNSHDPALHVSAGEKTELFDALESRLVDQLSRKVARHTRGR
ncbi:MAG: hypothetical protein AB1772_00745 [Candidatus Zixiibacteriota bacterium]